MIVKQAVCTEMTSFGRRALFTLIDLCTHTTGSPATLERLLKLWSFLLPYNASQPMLPYLNTPNTCMTARFQAPTCLHLQLDDKHNIHRTMGAHTQELAASSCATETCGARMGPVQGQLRVVEQCHNTDPCLAARYLT